MSRRDWTPEEWFRTLDDRRWWTDDSVHPRTETPLIRARRPLLRDLAIGAAVVVLAAVVVIGALQLRSARELQPIAPTPTPTSTLPTPSPTPTPTESSTAITQVEPGSAWSSPPNQLFDGDCGALLTDDAVHAVLGEGELVTSATDEAMGTAQTDIWPLFADLAHNGGLACGWRNDSESRFDSGPTFWVAAMPAALVPDALSSTACLASNDGGCRFRVGADGVLFDAFLSEPKPGAIEIAADLLLDIVPKIDEIAPVWSPRSGDWPADIDCGAIGREAIPDVANKKWGVSVRDAADMSVVGYDLAQGHGARSCVYGDSFGISYLAGGAWLEEQIVADYPDASHPSIEGADRTYRFVQNFDGDSTQTFAIVGENLLMINPGWEGDELVDEFAPGFIRALNTAGATNTTITTAGWGDIRLGQPVPENSAGVTWIPEMMPSCVPTSNWQIDAGGYVYTEDPGQENRMVKGGAVTEIVIVTPDIHTRSGAQLYMTAAELQEMFPTIRHDEASGAWIVSDELGQVVFYPHSDEPESPVEKIRVLPVGVDPGDFVPTTSCD